MPNFTMYPGMLPHVSHMKPKQHIPSFYMPDEIKLVRSSAFSVTVKLYMLLYGDLSVMEFFFFFFFLNHNLLVMKTLRKCIHKTTARIIK